MDTTPSASRVKTNGVIARVFAVLFGFFGVVMLAAGMIDTEWATIAVGLVFVVLGTFLWNVAKAAKERTG